MFIIMIIIMIIIMFIIVFIIIIIQLCRICMIFHINLLYRENLILWSFQELITADGNIIFRNFTYEDDDADVSHPRVASVHYVI